MEKKLFNDCKDKEKATDEDVKTMMARDIPTTRTGKCLIACVHENLGIVCITLHYQQIEASFAHNTSGGY